MYKLQKVFDCQDMPEDIRKEFFNLWDNYGNDCYLSYIIGELNSPNSSLSLNIDKWLIDNGATNGEEVIINHWW